MVLQVVARCGGVRVATVAVGMRFVIHVRILRRDRHVVVPRRRGHGFPAETRREDGDQHDEQHGTREGANQEMHGLNVTEV